MPTARGHQRVLRRSAAGPTGGGRVGDQGGDAMSLQEQNRLLIHQKTSLLKLRYRVFLDDGKGKPGDLVAFVEQDKASFKDKVVIYAGEDKAEVLAEFRARKLLDASSAFDVFTPDGDIVGSHRKEFTKSLYRSTWTLQQGDDPPITVVERSAPVAVSRRAWTLLPTVGEFPFPLRYHFDLVREGRIIGGVEKTGRLTDHYLAWTKDGTLDRRLLVAMGVTLDFRQGR